MSHNCNKEISITITINYRLTYTRFQDILSCMVEQQMPPIRVGIDILATGLPIEASHIPANRHLLVGVQRAFEAMKAPFPQGGRVVSLGCGTEPYLPAFKIFRPSSYLGIDTDQKDSMLPAARKKWTQYAAALGFTPHFEKANAIYPEHVLQQGETVHVATLIHPATTITYDTDTNIKYQTMVHNWVNRLDDSGYFIIVTGLPEETITFLKDPEIQSRVVAYGPTDVIDHYSTGDNAYIIVLQKNPSAKEPQKLTIESHNVQNELNMMRQDIERGEATIESVAEFAGEETQEDSFKAKYFPDIQLPRIVRPAQRRTT